MDVSFFKKLIQGKRIEIPLTAGHHWLASNTPCLSTIALLFFRGKGGPDPGYAPHLDPRTNHSDQICFFLIYKHLLGSLCC